MHTLSGRRFEIGDGWAPTLKDIAFSLSRLPRWGGATLVPWTVLHHSLAMYRLALTMPTQKADTLLYCLMHDVDEMATGDIPKPFKTEEQSELGWQLREWFYKRALRVRFPNVGTQSAVKYLDHVAKLAEAHCFCHPRVREDFGNDEVPMDMVDIMWDLFTDPLDKLIDLFINEAQLNIALIQRSEQA